MAEDIHRKSMKALEISAVIDEDLVTLDDYRNETHPSIYMPESRFLRSNKNVFYIAGGLLLLALLVAILLVVCLKRSSTVVTIVESKTIQPFHFSNTELSSPSINFIENTTSQLFTTSSTESLLSQLSDNEQSIHLSRALIMTSGRNLWAIDTNSWNWHLLRQTKRNIVAFDANVNESISWVERNSSIVSSLNDNLSLPYSKKLEPQAIAIDYITNKLYVIDEEGGTLNVIDMQRNYTGVVLSDLASPHDFVLDPLVCLVFIVQLNNSLLRCDMDGTSLIEIVKNKQISAITINRKIKRIYWLTNFQIIETSDYDGVDQLTFHKSNDFTYNILSLVFHDDQLFWLSADLKSEQTIVFSCNTDGIYCDDLLPRNVPFVTRTIRSAPEAINISKINPCATNNGECEQLCLLTQNGHSCACKIGWQLSTNEKTRCSPVTKFLIYSQGKHFRGRILESSRQTFVDVFSPTRFSVLSLDNKNSIDFDRGWTYDEVYFTDDLCIYRFNLTDGKQTKVYHITDFKNYHIQGLLVDRRSHNFYYCKKSNGFGDESILIMTIKGGQIIEKTLTSFKNDGISQIGRRFLALQSKFFFYILQKTKKIQRISLGSNELKQYWSIPVDGCDILAIDQNDNVTYWINSKKISTMEIDYSASSGGKVNQFDINIAMKNVTTFYLYQNWIYIGDDANIWRFDKKSGKDMIHLVSNHKWNSHRKIFGAQVSDLKLLDDEKESFCATNNGGCEQFCFDREKISCDCRDGMRISEDVYCK